MASRRLLWILPYMPWPTTSGGKLRQFQLLRELARRGHRISLLILTKTLPTPEQREALQPWVEQLWVYPRRPLRSWQTLLAGVFAGPPLLASINGYHPVLGRKLAELLEASWDVVQLEHSYSLQPYLQVLQGYRPGFVLTEHNIESELSRTTWQRLPAMLRPLARWDQWRYRRWERLAVRRARQVIAMTEADAEVLAGWAPTPVRVVPNGADIEAGSRVHPDLMAGQLLFLGNYEYSPNLEAVRWLAEEIMPRIWAERPDARLVIGGFAMPVEWAARWPDPRLQWLGYVEDLPTLQASCSLFIAPLRDGGGSKLKVLEAMAAGLPLASTAQGVSGLLARPERDYLAADDSAGLAAAAIQLLSDPARAGTLGEAGRDYVRRHHSWQQVADTLEQVYQEMAA